MGNIEIKEESITTHEECGHCQGVGYINNIKKRKYLDQELSPQQKRIRDECPECFGKGLLTVEDLSDKNFSL